MTLRLLADFIGLLVLGPRAAFDIRDASAHARPRLALDEIYALAAVRALGVSS